MIIEHRATLPNLYLSFSLVLVVITLDGRADSQPASQLDIGSHLSEQIKLYILSHLIMIMILCVRGPSHSDCGSLKLMQMNAGRVYLCKGRHAIEYLFSIQLLLLLLLARRKYLSIRFQDTYILDYITHTHIHKHIALEYNVSFWLIL